MPKSQFRDDAERLGITFESIAITVVPYQFVQLPLSNMSERRMTQVMGQRCGLNDVRINPT